MQVAQSLSVKPFEDDETETFWLCDKCNEEILTFGMFIPACLHKVCSNCMHNWSCPMLCLESLTLDEVNLCDPELVAFSHISRHSSNCEMEAKSLTERATRHFVCMQKAIIDRLYRTVQEHFLLTVMDAERYEESERKFWEGTCLLYLTKSPAKPYKFLKEKSRELSERLISWRQLLASLTVIMDQIMCSTNCLDRAAVTHEPDHVIKTVAKAWEALKAIVKKPHERLCSFVNLLENLIEQYELVPSQQNCGGSNSILWRYQKPVLYSYFNNQTDMEKYLNKMNYFLTM